MTKKQTTWVWFILALLPIILIIVGAISNSKTGNVKVSSTLNSMGFTADYNELAIGLTPEPDGQLIYNYETIFNYPLENSLEEHIYKLTTKLLQSDNPNYFIPQYLAYIIRLEILQIAVNVFLLLPKICNKLINKAVSNEKEE